MHSLPGRLLQIPFFNNYCLNEAACDGAGWEGGTDLPPRPFPRPRGDGWWMAALRPLFTACMNEQDLPLYPPPTQCITFSPPDLFLSRRSQTGGQPHRRQQNNLLSTALIICMAFQNNKRRNLDPSACQYFRRGEREILLSRHLPEQSV